MQLSEERLFFRDNEMTFTSNHLCIDLRLITANPPFFCVSVMDGNMISKEFSFFTLEEAVYFKHKISTCDTLEQVTSIYNKLAIIDGRKRKPTIPYRIEDGRMYISPEQMLAEILEYFKGGRNCDVEAKYLLRNENGKTTIAFYTTRYLYNKPLEIALTPDMLKSTINHIIRYTKYEVDSFECICNGDSFGGIEVYLKERQKPQKLNMTMYD